MCVCVCACVYTGLRVGAVVGVSMGCVVSVVCECGCVECKCEIKRHKYLQVGRADRGMVMCVSSLLY